MGALMCIHVCIHTDLFLVGQQGQLAQWWTTFQCDLVN